jgi:hypothetical protein
MFHFTGVVVTSDNLVETWLDDGLTDMLSAVETY